MSGLYFKYLKKYYRLLRYGRLQEEIANQSEFQILEIAYKNNKGKIIAYWAYGDFDPHFPVADDLFFTIKTQAKKRRARNE